MFLVGDVRNLVLFLEIEHAVISARRRVHGLRLGQGRVELKRVDSVIEVVKIGEKIALTNDECPNE